MTKTDQLHEKSVKLQELNSILITAEGGADDLT